ncbi:acetylserotonin O-methyltransferase 2 isoform X3 [Brienomyrus brachyistius]|nr:acetylserotonin O-methyltransferase 2 isoform X3 [Brienomyrus brachyistius]XP_048851529.1 acetylserotonin O-methyltransferase 2 isoform X3 [Brienomyrus brachyistius]XP_048851530.1 acetylserotonin O-methyltransferase 2 isoform X3 [Brienomyrus brachyistius]XP_048851531.1 acetylserotonin O-methyltransferase 2 isoform X3 [Brienomyrus brachyistius]
MAERLSGSELDYPYRLLEYLNGFRVSKVIFSACELGVFDLLAQSQKPLSAETVAQELDISADGAERLLDALVGVGILEVEAAEDKALYSATDVSNTYLTKTGGKSLHGMTVYLSQTVYPLWGNLTETVREGKNQNEKTFGIPSEDIFKAIYRSDEEMLKFMGLMNSAWAIDGHDVVTAFDLSPFKTVVDLGGCGGALARELAREYPSADISVLDVPRVVQAAKQHFSQPDDTIRFVEGDFFSGEIPASDLYILARIIHDWKEEKALQLLQKVHRSCRPGGGVLIVEALLFENKRGPITAQIFSLNMMVQTQGREHPPSHYRHLLSAAGFHNVQVHRTGKSYDAILGTK